jgi:hypothetical protein
VERSYKRSYEGLKKLDKYGLECSQEFINVCELEDALVCDLKEQNASRIYAERTGKGAYDKDQFEVIDESPLDGISILLILLFCCATLYESVTDETVDRGSRGTGQLGSLWGE